MKLLNTLKRNFLAIALILVLGSFDTPVNINYSDAGIPTECTYGQCKGIAKSTGVRCKHCVSNSGDSFCYQHKP
jgi:hypothetical protein